MLILFVLLSERNLVKAREKANSFAVFPSRSPISILQSKIKSSNNFTNNDKFCELYSCIVTIGYKMLFPFLICHRPPIEYRTLVLCALMADTAYDYPCRLTVRHRSV